MSNRRPKSRPVEKPADVGIIIGRFQVSWLHEAHTHLINEVMGTHKKVIIFLGVSPVPNTIRNPLDIFARQKMINKMFPTVLVSHIPDCASDQAWVHDLDRRIKELVGNSTVMLYGGRDSFLAYYDGMYDTKSIEDTFSLNPMSGTENRRIVSREVIVSEDFRKGVIYATYSRFPNVYQYVHPICFSDNKREVLMCRRVEIGNLPQFLGGFTTPEDVDLELAARRIFMRKTGAEPTDMKYFGSAHIEDWRYKAEMDKVMSILFATKLCFGPIAGSNQYSFEWVRCDLLGEIEVIPEHKALVPMIVKESQR